MNHKYRTLASLFAVLAVVFALVAFAGPRSAQAVTRTSLGYDDDGNSSTAWSTLKANGTTAVIMNDWCQSGTNATCNGYQSGASGVGMTPYVYRDLTSVRTDDCVPAGSGQTHPSTSCITGGFNLNNAPAADICPSSVVDAPTFSGGLPFCSVWENHPDWILKDTSGNYLQESGFSVQYETDYGNTAYQNAWISQMLSDATTYGWTAVFGDNALVTNDDYGIAEKYQTNAAVDTAMGSMIQAVGTALKNAGILFVPNVGYMNIEPQLWNLWLPYTTGEMNQHDVGGTTILNAEQNTCLTTAGDHCMFNNPNGDGPFDIYDGPPVSQGSAPTVNSDAASNVTGTGATLNGDTVPNGADTTCHFNWGTTTSYGSTTSGQDEGSGSTDEGVSANLTGLTPGATYHYDLECSNANGDVSGGDESFTASAVAPVVTTDAASGVTSSAATLNGDVVPGGADTTCHFNWGTTTAYGSTTTGTDEGSGGTDTHFSASLTGLTPSTAYDFQAECSNSAGDVTGANGQFTTQAVSSPPTVNADPVSGVKNYSAHPNGDVNPNGLDTTCHYNWGTTTAYGNTTPNQDKGSGTTDVTVDTTLTNVLQAGTTYHYQVECSNADGDVTSGDQSFTTTTTPGAPIPNTDPASGVTASAAQMNGDVFPDGASTSCWMNWGKQNPPTGNKSPTHSEGSGYPDVTDHWSLTGLPAHTEFWFQVECSNANGDVKGNVQSFTTSLKRKVAG